MIELIVFTFLFSTNSIANKIKAKLPIVKNIIYNFSNSKIPHEEQLKASDAKTSLPQILSKNNIDTKKWQQFLDSQEALKQVTIHESGHAKHHLSETSPSILKLLSLLQGQSLVNYEPLFQKNNLIEHLLHVNKHSVLGDLRGPTEHLHYIDTMQEGPLKRISLLYQILGKRSDYAHAHEAIYQNKEINNILLKNSTSKTNTLENIHELLESSKNRIFENKKRFTNFIKTKPLDELLKNADLFKEKTLFPTEKFSPNQATFEFAEKAWQTPANQRVWHGLEIAKMLNIELDQKKAAAMERKIYSMLNKPQTDKEKKFAAIINQRHNNAKKFYIPNLPIYK